MNSVGRYTFLLTALCWLAACAQFDRVAVPEPDDGIGGTGVFVSTDGIGGTGHRGDPNTDGIGGTGLWASLGGSGDVAIYGVVTSLKTLVVNGHGMFLSESLELILNGQPGEIAALNIGQVVAVRAGLVNGLITAKAIHADDAVIGPIDRVGADGTWLEVLGQQVALGAYTRTSLGSGHEKPATLRAGDVVRVSGLRRLDGSIDATLVQLTEPTTTFSVAGWAVPTADKEFSIGQLRFSDATLADIGDRAQRVIVTGAVHGGEFTAEKTSTRPALPFAGEVDYWSVQGYAASDPETANIRFSGYRGELTSGPDLELDFATEQRVIMGIRAGQSPMPAIDRVKLSPLAHPDASMIIPGYSPRLGQPEVVFAPTMRPIESAVGSDITIPQQRSSGIEGQTTGVPTVHQVPTVRPAVPRPALPRVDIEPRAVRLPPVSDSFP